MTLQVNAPGLVRSGPLAAGLPRAEIEAAMLRLLLKLDSTPTVRERMALLETFLADVGAPVATAVAVPRRQQAALADEQPVPVAVHLAHAVIDGINRQETRIGGRTWELRGDGAGSHATMADTAAVNGSASGLAGPPHMAQRFEPDVDDMLHAVLSGAAGPAGFAGAVPVLRAAPVPRTLPRAAWLVLAAVAVVFAVAAALLLQ